MTHIFEHHQIYSDVFSSHLGHYPLNLWIEDFNKSVSENYKMYMEYISVNHSNIIIEPNVCCNVDVDIYDTFDCYGQYDTDKDGNPISSLVGIEYTSLCELKNYTLKLNKEIIFTNNKTCDTICTMQRYFTVYDVIGTILYEISWSGPPTKRDKVFNEILNSVENSKKEGIFLTAEEMFSNLDKRIEEFKK